MSRGGATARLFVAIDPPLEVREELCEWARRATTGWGVALRLLEPHSLHLTLCFLGSRPVAEIDALVDVLQGHAEYVGELSVGAPLWLPPRRPRSLAVEIRDDDRGELTQLQRHLSEALGQISGWEPEHRRFRAHITLARTRGSGVGGGGVTGPGMPSLLATPSLRFTPESLALYRSQLSPAGAKYEALATCQLAP